MNKFAAVFIALLFVILVSGNANAGYRSETFVWGVPVAWLGIGPNEIFKVLIEDKVNDGCWTNSDAVKTAVELELKRSGYRLANSDEELGGARYIYVSGLGYSLMTGNLETGCAVSYQIYVSGYKREAFISQNHLAEGGVYGSLWHQGGIITGDKASFDARLKETFVNLIQSFLNSIDVKKKEALEAIRNEAEGEAKKFWDNYKLD